VLGVDLNRMLDRFPRLSVDVGHRSLPAFRSAGIVGYQAAVLVTVLVALSNGVGPAVALGVSATAGLSFFGWALLRRAATGSEQLVLIEYVWVALAAVAGFLWLSGTPPAAGLDLMAVAVCVFLAAGRLGCAMVGCCHGHPARVGLRYGPEHGLSGRLTDRRLLPVQLVEAAGLLSIGLVGFVLTLGTPGRATVWFLISYAVLRFGCEALRGDRRPSLLGMSVPRLSCAVQLCVGVLLADWWLEPGPPGRDLATSAGVLGVSAACGAALAVARRPGPLVGVDALDETWDVVASLAGVAGERTPVFATTSLNLGVAVTRDDPGFHVSLSHPHQPTLPVGVGLCGGAVRLCNGVTHLSLEIPGASPPYQQGDGEPPPAGPRSSPQVLEWKPAGYFDRPMTKQVDEPVSAGGRP